MVGYIFNPNPLIIMSQWLKTEKENKLNLLQNIADSLIDVAEIEELPEPLRQWILGLFLFL